MLVNLKFQNQKALEKIFGVRVKKLEKPKDDKCIIVGNHYETEKKEILIVKESSKRGVTNL